MARAPLQSLQAVADEVLHEVDQAAFMKRAETEIVREAARQPSTELGQLLHKVADTVRASDDDVTYEDLNAFLARGGRR